MNIRLITESTPACMGVCCPKHAACARYHAIEGSDPANHRIDTCRAADGGLPLFVPAQAPAGQVTV